MFDQYVKLFHLDWIELWMVEALIIMSSALLLGVVLCKVASFLNGDQQ
jgi:hypothetical protein